MCKLTIYAKCLKIRALNAITRFMKPETVFDILQPFMTLCQLLLVTPYKFSVESGEYFLVYSKLSLLLVMASALFFIRCVYVVIKTGETVVGHFNGTMLFKIGDWLRIYSNIVTVFVVLAGLFSNTHLYPVIFTLFSDIDKKFSLLSIDKHYERVKYKPYLGLLLAITIVFYTIFVVNNILANSWDSQPTLYLWVVIFIPNNMAAFYVVLYCTGVFFLDFNLDILNKEIYKMSKNKLHPYINNIYNIDQLFTNEINKNVALKTNQDLQLERLMMIRTIFDAICDGVSNLNRLFGLRILTIIGVSFTSVVFNIFFVLSVYMSIIQGENTMKNYTFLVYCLQSIILSWGNVIFTVYNCNSVKKKVNHSSEII